MRAPAKLSVGCNRNCIGRSVALHSVHAVGAGLDHRRQPQPTIEGSLSRNQYQFSVEDANPDELIIWVPKLIELPRQIP